MRRGQARSERIFDDGWWIQITRPSDLKNVCLVNKRLHEAAVKPLYHEVVLNLGSRDDARLTAFLNPRNIGLKHIRQVWLHLAPSDDLKSKIPQAHLATRMILEFLPEDILDEFRWVPWQAFLTDNLLLLYKKQRKMRRLEVMELDRSVLSQLKNQPNLHNQVFSCARKLSLYPESRETLDLCGFYVGNTAHSLEGLHIQPKFPELQNSVAWLEPGGLNDSATQPGLLSCSVFAHMMPLDKSSPLPKLKSLQLQKINLRNAADTWCKIVDFTKIETLKLFGCPGVDSLFGQLCKANNLPKQLKVFGLQHKDNDENEALVALDGLLCIMSGIRDLAIDLEGVRELPAAAGIARHGKTLEQLNVHAYPETSSEISSEISSSDDPDEYVYDTDGIELISNSCTRLEQLSCAWPSHSILAMPTQKWKNFEGRIALLKHLVTLHITTWPACKPTDGAQIPRPIYEELLRSLAQQIFTGTASNVSTTDNETNVRSSPRNELHLAPKLRLIAFGVSDKIIERRDSPDQLIFLRSTCQDADGRTQLHATPIGWCLRLYVEPRSEVLDFVLQRDNIGPPLQEASASEYGNFW